MFGLYLFCAIVGGAFVVFFVVFGGDADADVGGLDMDADIDLDADVESHSAWSDLASDYLSIRAAVFFLAFFGITGVVLDVLGANAVLALLLAVAMGALAVWVNARLMRFLRTSDLDGSLRNTDLAGRPARVVLPIAADSKGRVALDVAGQEIYLVARPFRAASFAVGDAVVVVEVDNGTALVASLEDM